MGYKAPSVPNPADTIAAQESSNKNTAAFNQGLNMVNVVDENGSTITYTLDPTKKPGDPGYATQVTNLSPDQKALLQQQTQNQTLAGQVAGKTIGDIANMPGQLDTSGLPTAVTGVQTPTMGRVGGTPTFTQMGAPTMGQTATVAGANERVSRGMLPQFRDLSGAGQGVQKDLNYRPLGALPTASDATRQRVEQAQYDRQAMYLDPQYQREAAALDAKLRNQGITVGSAAHTARMQEYEDAKARAYQQARESAIVSGGAEQSRLIADQLAIRGAGAREIENAGAFHNTAQGQGFGQNLQQAQFNTGQRQQAFQNEMALAAQHNLATNTDFQNQLSQLGFNNEQQQQQFVNTLNQLGFNNTADQQQFTNDVQKALANNTVAQQEFNNLMTNANLSNTQRERMFAELVAKYNLPLTKYSALMTGAMPDTNVASSQQIVPSMAGMTNVGGITADATNANINNAQNKWGAFNDLLGNVTKLGSAALMKPSDPRLKSNVEKKGFLPSGLPVYEYDIHGRRERGVMSTDVKKMLPQAVVRGRDGYDRVDYSQIG